MSEILSAALPIGGAVIFLGCYIYAFANAGMHYDDGAFVITIGGIIWLASAAVALLIR